MEIEKLLKDIKGFDWDEGNKDKNWEKHSVSVKESEEVFSNEPLSVFEDEKHSQDERRCAAFGRTNEGRLLTIIFTVRNSKIRIISARDQNSKERKNYVQ